MRDPKQYTRSLIICQTTVTVTYVVIGIVVYYFCGSFVASPALGSAGVTMKKICYGLALPGLLVTVTIVSHVSTPFRRKANESLIPHKASSQVHLHSTFERFSASYKQLIHALGRLARLHRRLHFDLLHYRERHPSLRRPCLAHWSSPGHSHVFPTHGIHVAV